MTRFFYQLLFLCGWLTIPVESRDKVLHTSASFCPAALYEHSTSFATILRSFGSKKMSNLCTSCIYEKANSLNILASLKATEWNCLELTLAAVQEPVGCSRVCLQQQFSQCLYVGSSSAIPSSLNVSPECHTCLAQAPDKALVNEFCSSNCTLACQLPSECYMPAKLTPDLPTCAQCLKQKQPQLSHDELIYTRCLLPFQDEGCREVCVPACGDGYVANSTASAKTIEQCDDGNLDNGDGCSSSCEIESGYVCSSSSYHEKSSCEAVCGDNITVSGIEECDDGNLNDTDGCDATCHVEKGYTCSSDGICTGICGDQVIVAVEDCDDGNTNDHDGCSSTCSVEKGFTCTSSGCSPVCGDGIFIPEDEQCDDGNLNDNDGCSSTCQVEANYQCTNISQELSFCSGICGDGQLVGKETCEDSNTINGDGCSSNCTIEPGYSCNSSVLPSTCTAVCGDGIVIAGLESCDDANLIADDGCSSTCAIENGFTCNSTSSSSVCQAICGDGKVNGDEECDDYNVNDQDGCSSTCKLETGYTCAFNASTKEHVSCSSICGDNLVRGTEACDDGNLASGDGCNASCAIEVGYHCASSPSSCSPICGDGLVIGNEECDDQNLNLNDGCNANCSIEAGYACTSAPSLCAAVCGDGLILENEECDDGNVLPNDGCNALCRIESGFTCTGKANTSCVAICGDGQVVGTEDCDDRNLLPGDGCDALCTIEQGFHCVGSTNSLCLPLCGDKVVLAPEECDDGNQDDNDGCSSSCTLEDGFLCDATRTSCSAICGDGNVVGKEECDDGNTDDNDGCSSTCTIEVSTINPLLVWKCPTPNAPCSLECRQDRVRKPWKSYSFAEQQLYLRAIEISMERGLYATFVGIHYEQANEQQAHTTCAFLVWHRKYLLGFENMLRSLGPEFACLTLPYWGYFSDYTNYVAGRCRSIQACSPICQSFNTASASGTFRAVNVPGSGRVNSDCTPYNAACPLAVSSHGTATCARCLPRGSWDTAAYPAGLGYGSIARLISANGMGYSFVTNSIQRGFHNTIHSTLGGMMATLASPADPIFYAHHNTIDMAYQAHHHCVFGTRKLTPTEKQTNREAYQACGASARDGTPSSTSRIRFDVFSPSLGRLIPVEESAEVGEYFRDTPSFFWEYVDSTDLGRHSYSYEIDSLLSGMMENGLTCSSSASFMFAENSGLRRAEANINVEAKLLQANARVRELLAASSEASGYLASAMEEQSQWQYFHWFNETCTKAKQVQVNGRYLSWEEILDQVELIECLNYERTHGHCQDYSALFRQSFNIHYKSRCRDLVDNLSEGSKHIYIPNWQQECNKYFQSPATEY